MKTQPIMKVRRLSIDIPVPNGVLHAVKDVSFDLAKGQTLCIVGESGSGKSMLALGMIGLLPHQARLFSEAASAMERVLGHNVFKYIASSRAAFLADKWDFDGVRPGIVLYGYGTAREDGRFKTRPVLQWKTRVAQVKRMPSGYPIGYYGTHVTAQETYIATIAVGYADGYNRALSNQGEVLIGGRRYPVVGRVSMNWVSVDLGPATAVQVGDEVVLIGAQGDEAIWANELAKICRTIPYEILTSINSLVERKYI